jgi:putative redox protein
MIPSLGRMTDDTERSVQLERIAKGHLVVRNVRGGSITIGSGDETDFTPVELLLAAIGGCTGLDVDFITSKRAEPTEFSISVTGNKIRDDAGANRMTGLAVSFAVSFPEGDAGDAARDMLPRAVQMSHDRLCTVSRTVQLGTPIATTITN